MTKSIPHYLRRHRLRRGLTQRETAYLVGNQTPATVCQHEGLSREPDLRSALAYQVVYGVPADELFGGIYKDVEEQVTKRAHELSKELPKKDGNAAHWHKQNALRAIATRKVGGLKQNV